MYESNYLKTKMAFVHGYVYTPVVAVSGNLMEETCLALVCCLADVKFRINARPYARLGILTCMGNLFAY